MAAPASGTIQIEDITPSSSPDAIAQAQILLLEYGRFVIANPGAARFCFGTLEKEAERLPSSYLEQGGGCLIARVEGDPAGFVAWRQLPAVSPEAAELKRLWVRPEARGLGLGSWLVRAVLDRARLSGRKAIYLDTATQAMAAAYRMYLAMGFVPCDSYKDDPPTEGIAYLVRHL